MPSPLLLLLGAATAAAVLPAADVAPAPAPIEELRFSLQDLDRSVDPRQDFLKFAAGGWLATARIPDDQYRWTSFNALERANWEKIHAVLEAAAADTTAQPNSPTRMAALFYSTALDTAAIEAAGLTPIEDLLTAIAAIDSPEALARTSGRLRRLGVGVFGAPAVRPDARDSGRYTFYLTQGGLGLPNRDYYCEEAFAEKRTAYVAHVRRMLELLGDAPAAAQDGAETVLAIETAFARASKRPVELRDPVSNYHRRTLAELEREAAGFPWHAWAEGLGVPALDSAVLNHPPFAAAVAQEVAQRPLAQLRTYLRWQLVRAYAAYLPAAFEDEGFRFNETVLRGTPQQEPRWRRAARAVDAEIGDTLGQLYVARYFPPEAKARMEEMVGHIRAAFRARLERLDWMTPETRARALAKFASFRAKIGYPDKWKTYAGLVVARDSHAANVRRAREWEADDDLAKLGQPVDPDEWGMTPPTVNAYFASTRNEIVFPAGILQPPFFDLGADEVVNFGAIACVIGHEITHGFDDQGRKFDGRGNLVDWWQETDAAAFQQRAEKLVAQYGAYEALPGKGVNGRLCLGENIADLGGVSVAYEALQRFLAAHGRPEAIDGFTPEQRFFLSWAQLWGRTLYRPEALERQLATDPHAPGNFRAFGPLVNLPEFLETWGIREGDAMWRAPELRAKIW
ncbi:MAG: M13 family metallopeptidase [Opitutaceae bacterium]